MTAEILKTKFATGKKPTEGDFSNLIDEIDGKTKPSDLTGLAKTSDLTGLAKTSDLSAYAKTTALTDLAKKSDLTGLAKKAEVPTKVEYDALVKRVEALEVPKV